MNKVKFTSIVETKNTISEIIAEEEYKKKNLLRAKQEKDELKTLSWTDRVEVSQGTERGKEIKAELLAKRMEKLRLKNSTENQEKSE